MYCRVVGEETQFDDIAKALRDVPAVEAAYIKPAAEPPINRMTASGARPPRAGTPDFTSRQDYLAAAPGGYRLAQSRHRRGRNLHRRQ
jgi:hypothetical protein